MKRTVTLSKDEIDEAIKAYVLDKVGFGVGSVRLTYMKGDRPFDSDYWEASVTEKTTVEKEAK